MNIQHIMHTIAKSAAKDFIVSLQDGYTGTNLIVRKIMSHSYPLIQLVDDVPSCENPFGEFRGLAPWVPTAEQLRTNQWEIVEWTPDVN